VTVVEQTVACFTQRSADGHPGQFVAFDVHPESPVVADTEPQPILCRRRIGAC
jgi:hypothetical protein